MRRVDADRVLATILFCEHRALHRPRERAGDRRWHTLLDSYYAMIRRQLERFAVADQHDR